MDSSEVERRLDERDRPLLHVIDSSFAEAAHKSGHHLACRSGCTECCIGPFPITMLDARRLRKGMVELDARDPARAAQVRGRAQQYITMIAADFPGSAQGLLNENIGPYAPFWRQYGDAPCPALDPATGACEAYAARPVTCRRFGPPLKVGARSLPHCRLCFVGASEEEIESCRVVIDPEGVEQAALDELQALSGETGKTLIAFALASVGPSDQRA
jgi:Fe-S-cluster containining protein